MISTHAPLAGRDVYCVAAVGWGPIFQPTRPLRGATLSLRALPLMSSIFQPTRPLRGATQAGRLFVGRRLDFNPRAPCGARPEPLVHNESIRTISTHAPLAGRDRAHRAHKAFESGFQPTRPLRGATSKVIELFIRHINFNPRAPCGARPSEKSDIKLLSEISTHAPLAGRDSKRVQITMHIFAITDKFQMLLHRMPPVRAFCSFLMQENHADFGCEPPK